MGISGWLLGPQPSDAWGAEADVGGGDLSPLFSGAFGGKLKGGSQTERMLEPQATGHFLPRPSEAASPSSTGRLGRFPV